MSSNHPLPSTCNHTRYQNGWPQKRFGHLNLSPSLKFDLFFKNYKQCIFFQFGSVFCFSLFSFWFFMTCLAKMSYSLCNKTGHLSLAGAKHGTCRSIVNRHCSAFSGVGCKCYAYAPMAPGWLSMVSAADRMSKQPCSSL